MEGQRKQFDLETQKILPESLSWRYSRFCIWLLAFTSLAREMASKLTSFLAC